MGKYYGPKYGKRAHQNVEWHFDIALLLKFIVPIGCMGILIGMFFYIQNKREERDYRNFLAAEAREVNHRYLERRLEAVKQETITAEQLRLNREQQVFDVASRVKRDSKTGPKMYMWFNENGQKVYSNKPREIN